MGSIQNNETFWDFAQLKKYLEEITTSSELLTYINSQLKSGTKGKWVNFAVQASEQLEFNDPVSSSWKQTKEE